MHWLIGVRIFPCLQATNNESVEQALVMARRDHGIRRDMGDETAIARATSALGAEYSGANPAILFTMSASGHALVLKLILTRARSQFHAHRVLSKSKILACGREPHRMFTVAPVMPVCLVVQVPRPLPGCWRRLGSTHGTNSAVPRR